MISPDFMTVIRSLDYPDPCLRFEASIIRQFNSTWNLRREKEL